MTSTTKEPDIKNLRGRSFKGQDLSGEDFSGADLRGTDFTDAILIGANFSKSKTGLQKRWLAFQLIISFLMSALSDFLATYAFFLLVTLVTSSNVKTNTISQGIAALIVMIFGFFALVLQGFTAAAFGTLALLLALAGALAGTAALVLALTVGAIVAGIVGAIVASIMAGLAGIAWLVVAWIVELKVLGTGGVAVLLGTGATMLLSIYVSWRTLKGDPKFDILLKFGIAFASIGGTSFRGADLRDADFTEANLKSSDFRNSHAKTTNLTFTFWKQAKKLDRARVGQSILANPEVRELLVTGKPNPSKSYEGLNLRGAKFEDGAYLKEVNFKRAILSEASFRNANLEWVNLTEAQAIGTDFTGAQMTGVCLEGWSYDQTTKLDDVDCRFVFELEHPNAKGSRERRPHDPDKEFAEGDFTKRYSETLNVVQLLIRNGINREAFIAAWEKLTEDYPDINPDDIQEIKKKGQDVELTVAVPEDTDKGQFERSFDRGETKIKEIEAKHQAQLLEEKDRTIETMKDMYFALAEAKKGDVTVITQTEAKSMTEQNPVTFTARDITNSVVNLGKIKGNVTNAINQIPVQNTGDSPDIKTLLTQLQEAISAEKELTDEDKADALEKVEELAQIALNDKSEEKSTLASKAIRALKRIINTIPTITKIVETVSKFFGA